MKAFKKAKSNIKVPLTDELIKRIENTLRAGAYIETAAAVCGVCKQTLYEWFKKGNKKPDSIYGKLLNVVDKAQAESEVRDLLNIDNSAMGRKFEYERTPDGKLVLNNEGNPIVISYGSHASWQASAWRLERKHPKKWGRIERVEAITEIKEESSETSEQRLKRLKALAKKLKLTDDE